MPGAFKQNVLTVLRQVPRGKVITYGEVALIAGFPGAARAVGTLLRGGAYGDDVPWQRVIGAGGRITTYRAGIGDLQRQLLELEGVEVAPGGRIDLSRFGWR